MNEQLRIAAATLILVLGPLCAKADIITYDISWAGFAGNTITGVFTFDDSSAADGFIRDRDNELLSLELSSTDYGLMWTWSADPTNPFNFNFEVATALFPISGLTGSVFAQYWNATGPGLGIRGNDGRIFSTIDGRPREPTASLIATKRPVSVPEPGTLTLLGIGLFGLGLARKKSA